MYIFGIFIFDPIFEKNSYLEPKNCCSNKMSRKLCETLTFHQCDILLGATFSTCQVSFLFTYQFNFSISQGSNYIFRSDPRKCSGWFQQVNCKKIVYSLTLFGIIYKRIVTLTTFNDSLQIVLQLLNQLIFETICLLFYVKNVRQVPSSKECLLHTHPHLSLWKDSLTFFALSVRNYYGLHFYEQSSSD